MTSYIRSANSDWPSFIRLISGTWTATCLSNPSQAFVEMSLLGPRKRKHVLWKMGCVFPIAYESGTQVGWFLLNHRSVSISWNKDPESKHFLAPRKHVLPPRYLEQTGTHEGHIQFNNDWFSLFFIFIIIIFLSASNNLFTSKSYSEKTIAVSFVCDSQYRNAI